MIKTVKAIFQRMRNRNLAYLISLDSIAIILSFLCGIFFRYDFSFPNTIESFLDNRSLVALVTIKLFSFRIFGLYRGLWRYTSVWDMFNIIKANIVGSVVLTFILMAYDAFNILSRSIVVIDFIICTGFICMTRLGIRLFFSHIRNLLKKNDQVIRNIIIIGAGDSGQTIFRQLLQKRNSSMRVVAFIDDNPKKIGQRLHDVPVYGPINNLNSLNINFDDIYICAPSASKNQLRLIIDECRKTKKSFKTLPSLSELIEGKASISQFRDVSILDLLGRDEVTLDKSSINSLVEGKRVLITGAGGSIGSELVRQCLNFNPSVLVMLEISELNLFEIEREVRKLDSNTLIKPVLCDIRDSLIIEEIFEEYKPQIVFHAAAYKHVPIQEVFPWEAVKTNVYGTLNLSKLSIMNDVEKFVLVSTDKAVNPVNVMGATKRIAELIIQDSNKVSAKTSFLAVRFGNVLGSSGSVIPIFKEQIRAGGPVTVTDPDMERYFMSIPEASQLILQAGSLGEGGEIFILDMGDPIKIIDLAADLIRLSGFDADDIPIKIIGSRPGEKKTEELSNQLESLDKTKHEKIFVLDNFEEFSGHSFDVISELEKLELKFNERNASKIKSVLSSFLDEYKPDQYFNEGNYIKKNKAEA